MHKVNIKLKLDIANYILDNKCNYTEAGKHFGKYASWVSEHMKYFKENDVEFYNKIRSVADEAAKVAVENNNRVDVDRMMKFVNYILENKCTYKKCGDHFGVSGECARSLVVRVERVDKELYNKVRKVIAEASCRKLEITPKKVLHGFTKNKETCKEVAKWIIENKETYEKAADHFNVSSKTIANCMSTIKADDPELFKRMKKANMEGRIEASSIGGKGGWCKTVGEKQLDSVSSDEKEEAAKETMKRMLWFK